MSATASTSQKRWKSCTTSSEANNSSGDSFSRSSTAKKSAVLSYDELAEWEVGKVLGRETPFSLVSVARENSVRSRLSGSSKRESPRDQFRNGGVAADPLDLDIHMVAAAALAHAKAESKSNEMYALTARDKMSKSDSRSRSKIKSQSGQAASKSKGVLAAIINLDESQLKNSTQSYGSNESFVNHDDESEEKIHMKAARDDGPVMEMTEEEGEEAPTVTDDEEDNNVQRGDESSLSNGNEGGDEDESADSHEATFYDTRTNCSKTSKTPSESNTTITTTKSAFPNAIDSIQQSQPPPPPSDESSEPPSPKTLRAIEESQRQRAISEATQTLLGNYELTPEERLKLLKEVQRALDKQGRQHSLMSDAEPEDDTVTWNEDSTFFSHDYDEDEEEGGESTVFTGYTGHTGYTGNTTNTDYTGYTTNTGCSNNTGYSSHYTVNTGYSSRHTNHTGHNSVYTSGTGNIDGDLTMTTTMTMDEDGTCFTKEDGSFFTNEESYKLDVKAMDRDEDDDTIAFLAGGCFRPCNPFKNWGTNAKSVLPHDDSSKEKIDQNKESLANSTVVSSVRSRLKKYNRDDTLSTSESILRDLRSMDSSSTSVDDKRSVQKNPDRPELPDSESKVILNPLTPSNSPYLRKRMETLHGMCFHLDADLESAGENDSLLTNLGMESPVEVGIEARLKFDDDDPSTEEVVDDNIEVDALPSVKHAEPRCESTTERITNNIDKESSEVASAATGGSDSKQEGKDRAAIVEPPVIESILTKPTSDQAKNTAKKSETQSISKPSEFRREMSNAASLATQQASNRTSAINATKKIQERIAIERALAVMHSGLWRSYIDPKTGRKYYSDGKVSTWTPPEGMREDDRENEQKSKVSSRQTKMANASAAVGQWTKTIRNKMSSKRKEGSEAAAMNITSRAETKEETIKKKTTPNPAVNERRRNSVTYPKKTTNQQHERKLEVKTERRNAPLHPRDQSATDPTNHNKTGEKSISWKALTLNDLVKKKSQSANSTDHKKASILNKKSVLNKSSKGTTSPPSNRALRSPTPKKPRVKNSSSSSLTTTNNRKPQSVVTLTSKNQVSSLSSPKLKASKHRAERKTQTSNSKAESIPTSPARTEASTSSESSITKTSPTSSEKERINLQPVSKPVDQTEFVKKEATDGSSIATDNCTADSDASAAAVLMRSINEGSKRVTMITFT